MHPRLCLYTIVPLREDKEPVGGVNRNAAEGPVFSELEVIDQDGSVTTSPIVSRDRPGGGLAAATK